MKVYLRTSEPRPRFTMMVTPGDGFGENSNKTLTIIFLSGCAEVPDDVGRWMVDTGRASYSKYQLISAVRELIIPKRYALNGKA